MGGGHSISPFLFLFANLAKVRLGTRLSLNSFSGHEAGKKGRGIMKFRSTFMRQLVTGREMLLARSTLSSSSFSNLLLSSPPLGTERGAAKAEVQFLRRRRRRRRKSDDTTLLLRLLFAILGLRLTGGGGGGRKRPSSDPSPLPPFRQIQ